MVGGTWIAVTGVPGWIILPDTAAPSKTDSGGQPLILNIDSEPATLHRLGHELRRHGYITSNATTPAEALRRARGLRPDLITLDLLTPGFDAFALLRTLRENPTTRPIRVALVSLHVAGARIEVSDGFAYLPRTVETGLLGDYIRTSLGPKILAEDGSGSSVSRNTRAVVLVVGDAALADKVQGTLAGVNTVHIVTTASPDEADSRVSGLFPELVVLDTAAAPGNTAGQWIARLKNRRPGVRLPAIILTDPEILGGETFPLPQQGSGSIKLERLTGVLDAYLHHDPSETEVATNSQ
jgi:CheY-like chemotaxis protein